MDVAGWLRALGLERYEQAFHDNDIDAGVLSRLTADDLIAIGVTPGDCRAEHRGDRSEHAAARR